MTVSLLPFTLLAECAFRPTTYRLLLRIVRVLGTARLQALEEAEPAGRESVNIAGAPGLVL